jgi:putative membrane protein
MLYLWLKVIHIVAMVAWMAGLFYLPRLFVYHADKAVGSELDATFKVMERRLLKAIIRPAAVVTLFSGAALLYLLSPAFEAWLVMKLSAVALLFGFHGLLEQQAGQFAKGLRAHGSRYYRLINEVPTVLLIVIVVAVIVRPFSS